MAENNEKATPHMQRMLCLYLTKWSDTFVENYKQLDPNRDEGDLKTLVKLLSERVDPKSFEESYGFACIPHVFWNKEMIGFFLEKKCDVNAKDKDGRTALHHAVFYLWEKNDDVIQFLLEKGADPNVPDEEGVIPIFNLPLPAYLMVEQQQKMVNIIFEMLLDNGTNLQAKDPHEGNTLLHWGAEILDVESLQKFFDNNYYFEGNVDACRNKSGETPFLVAWEWGKYDNCRLLLDRGADVNAKYADGHTSIRKAVYHNNVDKINFLMKNNADPNIRSNSGRDVYELACLIGVDFTEGAKPAKLVQIFEMKGTIAIIRDSNYEKGLGHWKEALDICAKYNLKPSSEIISNYYLLAKTKYQNSGHGDKFKLDLYRAAIKTMDKISIGSSKLWNVLSAASGILLLRALESAGHSFSPPNRSVEELMEILSFNSGKLVSSNAAEGFPLTAEHCDVISLGMWIDTLYYNGKNNSSNVVLLNFVKFAISCFSKWKQSSSDRNYHHFHTFPEVYFKICSILIRIQPKGQHDAGNKKGLTEEITQLIKSIVELETLDDDFRKSVLHCACQNWDSKLVETLIDVGANVQAINDENQTPIELIASETFKDKQNLKVIMKMIYKGSPNVDGKLLMEKLLEKYKL